MAGEITLFRINISSTRANTQLYTLRSIYPRDQQLNRPTLSHQNHNLRSVYSCWEHEPNRHYPLISGLRSRTSSPELPSKSTLSAPKSVYPP